MRNYVLTFPYRCPFCRVVTIKSKDSITSHNVGCPELAKPKTKIVECE